MLFSKRQATGHTSCGIRQNPREISRATEGLKMIDNKELWQRGRVAPFADNFL